MENVQGAGPVLSAPVTGSFVPAHGPEVVLADMAGETVLLNVRDGRLHVLDPVASLTWKCFDGTATLDELVVDLDAVFGVGEERVRADVIALVGLLATNGLLATGTSGGRRAPDQAHGESEPPRPPSP